MAKKYNKASMNGAASLEKWKLLLSMTSCHNNSHSHQYNPNSKIVFVFSLFQGIK